MQSHQRYFPLGGARFAFVANGGDPDVVRTGNERVLEGRLDDAAFSLERDVEHGIEAMAAELDRSPSRQGRLARGQDRRLEELVDALGGGEASTRGGAAGQGRPGADARPRVPRARGLVGGEYARLAGYPEAGAAAIDEHYLPTSRRAAAADRGRARARRPRTSSTT